MNYWIFVFILLSAVGFYNPRGVLSDQMQKLVFYGFTFIGLIYTFFQSRKGKTSDYPRVLYTILVGGICLSMFMAFAFHDQGIKDTVVVTASILIPYSTLYIFIKLGISAKKIMNTLIVLSFISSAVYLINTSTAPNFMFGHPLTEEDLSRGILRISIVYIELFPLMLFYAINQWIETGKKRWILYGVFIMIMISLSVIRQVIALSVVLALWYILKKVSISKGLIITAVVAVLGFYVVPKIPIFKTMLELTQKQKEYNDDKEDIRITAWNYYTIENQTNAITPFFGNGIPALQKSPWGIAFDQEIDSNKCYAVDVGWAGFYYYFGIFTTFALLLLLIKGITYPKSKNNQFTTYWLIFVIVTSIMSGPILYYYQIIDITLVLYLAFFCNTNSKESENLLTIETRPQFMGYPQLKRI